MILCFELGMPNNNSWNGHWSGEKNYYAKVVNYGRDKKAKEILDKGKFYYNFGDGWIARITIRKIDSKEAERVRRKSKGFCGYDWMIDSIMAKGCIVPNNG